MSKKLEMERDCIECQECYETLPFDNFFLRCSKGHGYCETCMADVDGLEKIMCKACGGSEAVDLRYNPEFEELLGKLKFECRYVEHGCSACLPWSEQAKHERDCPYSPTPCPLGCEWCGIHPEDHLSTEHHIQAVTAPYASPLGWTITLDKEISRDLAMNEDGDYHLEEEEGRHWNILVGFPLEAREKNWFLITAEQPQQEDHGLGPISVQVRHLNFEGNYSARLQSANETQFIFKWKIPSLRSAKKRAIISSEQIIQDAVLDATNSRRLTLFLSITPETDTKGWRSISDP